MTAVYGSFTMIVYGVCSGCCDRLRQLRPDYGPDSLLVAQRRRPDGGYFGFKSVTWWEAEPRYPVLIIHPWAVPDGAGFILGVGGAWTGSCSLKPKIDTLYCQKYLLICLDLHINISAIPFLIDWRHTEPYGVQYDVSPPFATITASTLLGRLSTRFRSVYGNFWPFFQKSICEVTHWCWTRRPGSQSPL